MILDRSLLEEYPFEGEFYTYEKNSETWGGEPTRVSILTTECDIQESQKSDAYGNISASFNIYFPFDKVLGVEIKRGMLFKGNMYGMNVEGEVMGVFPTQMGGCACYIKDLRV